MFDPLTFIKNKSLFKDYLERKHKEKIFLKKLIKNNLEELLINFNIYNNNESNNTNQQKTLDLIKLDKDEKIKEKKMNLSVYNKKKLFENKTINKVIKNDLFNYIKTTSIDNYDDNNPHKKYLKPSDYVNEIAKRVLENIGKFKNKKYEDKKNTKEDNIFPYNEEKDDFFEDISNKKTSLFDIPMRKNYFTNISTINNIKYTKTDKNKNNHFDIKNNNIKDKIETERKNKINED